MKRQALIAVVLLMTAPVHAETEVEKRLLRLEREIHELREENRELRRALRLTEKPAAPAPNAALSTLPVPPRLRFGGFLQAQAESGGRVDSRYSDDNARGFVRRARLNAIGDFREGFDFKLELDLAGNLSSVSGARAQMTDGYIGWTRHPGATLRVGQFKTPFGFEQLLSDTRLPTPERTLGSDRLTPGRQLGVQLAGDLFNKRLSYAAGAFNGSGANANANDNDQFLTAARLSGSAWQGTVARRPSSIEVGLNAFTTRDHDVPMSGDFGFDSTPLSPARDNLFSGKRDAWGANARAVVGELEAWVELIRVTFAPDDAVPARQLRSTAANIEAIYMATGKLQAVVRYDTFDAATSSSDTVHSWLGGVNYLIKGNDLKLQLHVTRSNGTDDRARIIARVQTIF